MMNYSANRAILIPMPGMLRDARWWTAAVLAGGWGAMLLACWPGELSYDSIVQLHDAREGFYHSWHPPVMAWLLGLGDALASGTGVFLLSVATLFYGALISLAFLRPRASRAAIWVALAAILLPQLVLYQGIVWKDVLFANLAIAGFVLLAHADVRWERFNSRALCLGGAFVLLVLAGLARQNGLVAPVLGAVAFAVMAGRRVGTGRAVLAGAGALALLLAGFVLSSWALGLRSDGGEGPREQVKLLRLYDLSAAVAARPDLPLASLDRQAPELARLIRTDGARLYTPERNDRLADSAALQDALGNAEPGLMARQWYDLVFRHPALYLGIRARDFFWVFLTPDIDACRPVFTGVDGPEGEMRDLGITPRHDRRDAMLAAYAGAFRHTPVLSHAAYAVLALAALVLLLRRRSPGDGAIAAMLIAALLFAASFFVISIACDYRYLYFLDLSAVTALLYLAVDPQGFQVSAIWSGSSWELRSAQRKS